MARAVALTLLTLALAGCGHLPGHTQKPPEPPGSVQELMELASDGTKTNAFPQYWVRNTLVIDMLDAAPSGEFIVKPRGSHPWPMRVALRVRPGSVGLIEARAEQRMIIPVTRDGTAPVDIELAPGVYTAYSPQMTVRWQQ